MLCLLDLKDLNFGDSWVGLPSPNYSLVLKGATLIPKAVDIKLTLIEGK